MSTWIEDALVNPYDERGVKRRLTMVSGIPRSLIATTATSCFSSSAARSVARPVLPKPLIATLTVMTVATFFLF